MGAGADDHDLSLSHQSRGERQGGIVPPPPVLVPGSALTSRRRVALSSAQAILIVAPCQHGRKDHADQMACRAVAGDTPPFSRRQLAIPLCEDQDITPGWLVGRRNITNGAVQAGLVVMPHVISDQPPGVVQRQWRSRADALGFQRAVPTLNLAIVLGIVCGYLYIEYII